MEHANELDGDRAQQCIQRLGPKQAVRRDVERLIPATMPLVWVGSIPRIIMINFRQTASVSSSATCVMRGIPSDESEPNGQHLTQAHFPFPLTFRYPITE